MTQATQSVVLTLLGATLLRLSLTDEHLTFVQTWMRWPLLATGVMVLVLSLRIHLSRSTDHHEGHGTPAAAWLLVLPALVLFVTVPPPLGAYVLERDVNNIDARQYDEPVMVGLPAGDVVPLTLLDFITRAQFDRNDSLAGRQVRLTGFVTTKDDRWYVSRLSIRCCAADALGYQVEARGAPAPPRDQWVEVTGTWVDPGSPAPRDGTPTLEVAAIEPIDPPKTPYE